MSWTYVSRNTEAQITDSVAGVYSEPKQTCTLCLRKKRANFETVYLKIIKIDFYNILQKKTLE